jgi:hypothetical protein
MMRTSFARLSGHYNREASGFPDNELSDEFIASNIVVPLHRDLGLLCRREWLYRA